MPTEIKDTQFVQEARYLDKIRNWIAQEINRFEEEVKSLEENEVEIKAIAWDERMEMKEGVNQADNALFQQSLRDLHSQIQDIKRQIKEYNYLKERPYFGKIIFSYGEEGEEDREAYYVGLKSLYDTENCESLVLDWRSPLASLYYDSAPGKVTIEGPRGPIAGILHEKKIISIGRGKLIAVEDYNEGISDQFLREILSRPASGELREIVSTIQKTQNAIIRHPEHESFFLLGVAGSGKTSIAVHRAAWLLYRQRFGAKKILFLSPNRLFGEYVMSVLPALGEETFSLATAQELELELVNGVSSQFKDFDFAEASHERLQSAASTDLVKLIDTFIKDKISKKHKLDFPDLGRYYTEFLASKLVEENINGLYEPGVYRRYDRVDLAILARIAQIIKPTKNSKLYYYLLIDEAQDLLPIEHAILREMFDCPVNLFADTSQAIRFDLEEDYLSYLSNIYRISEKNFIELKTTYRSTYEIMNFAKKIIGDEELVPFARHGEGVRVDVVATPEEQLMRIMAILTGFYERGARRIAVITPNEVEQKMMFYGISKLSGSPIDESQSQLGKGEFEPSLNVRLDFDNFPWPSLLGSDTSSTDQTTKTTPDEGFEIYVLDSTMAKGLEFDAVLVSNASSKNYSKDRGRRLLYVACTRALHELHILAIEKLSEFIQTLDK